MIDRRIGKVKLRRGTDLQRKSMIFEEGEIIYATDTQRAFIGDGITKGGIRISGKNFLVDIYELPENGSYGDIVHVKTTKKTYIIGYDLDGITLKLYFIADASIADQLNNKLKELTTKFANISACLAATKPPKPPPTKELMWITHPISQTVKVGDTVNFSAIASGPVDDIKYGWQKFNSLNQYELINNSLGELYTIYNVELIDATYYRCIATSTAGTIYSNPALITIKNDDGINDTNYLLAENGDFIVTEKEEYIEVILGSIDAIVLLTTEDDIEILSESGEYIEVTN